MFLLNSRHPLFFSFSLKLHIPKLRSKFAEFLKSYYLFCNHIFSLLTCGWILYGYILGYFQTSIKIKLHSPKQ